MLNSITTLKRYFKASLNVFFDVKKIRIQTSDLPDRKSASGYFMLGSGYVQILIKQKEADPA